MAGMDLLRWEERLVEWKDATRRELERRWWLWPAILLLELLHDRLSTFLNRLLDEHAGGLISGPLRSPVEFAAVLGVLVIVALAFHAYVETRAGRMTTAVTESVPQLGPRLVIDYSYEQSSDRPQRTLNNDQEAPLVVRNVDPQRAAYNVRLLPLSVEGETVEFTPELIPSIEPNGRAQVFAKIVGVGFLGEKRLPIFFKRFYKDKSAEELFKDKLYTLKLEYDDGNHSATTHFAECQLRYRPWKDRIEMGAVCGYSRQRRKTQLIKSRRF